MTTHAHSTLESGRQPASDGSDVCPALGKRFEAGGRLPARLNAVQSRAAEALEQRLDRGLWSWERVPCAICGGTAFDLLASRDKHGLPVSCVACRSCGFVQLSPRWNAAAYDDFYANLYRDLYQGVEADADEAYLGYYFDLQAVQGRLVHATLTRAGAELPPNARVLEVGCSAGGVLKAFHDAGHTCIGLDYDERYLAHGRDRGLHLATGDLRDSAPADPVDLIIYSHVLEHISDIHDELRRARAVLRDGGLMFVEVPGLFQTHTAYDFDFKRSLQCAHVFYFTRAHLCALMEQHGFETLDADEHVRGVFRCRGAGQRPPTQHDVPRLHETTVGYLQRTERDRRRRWPWLTAKRRLKKAVQGILSVLGLELAVRKLYRWLKNRPG